MLTEEERNEIKELSKGQKGLPPDLKSKLEDSLKSGDPSIFEGERICCDTGYTNERYQQLTFDECRSIGGKVVDNSYCSRVALQENTQTIYGPAVETQGLHNTVIGQYDPKVYRMYANAWFRKYILKATAPAGWYLFGEPWVNCIKDDQGAFGWNRFPFAHDRFYVDQRDPKQIVCVCWAGSRSITINLACQAKPTGT